MADVKVKIRVNQDRVRLQPGPQPVRHIKSLTTPPVPPDHELWLDIDGGADQLLDNSGTVDVVEGLVFYSVGPDGGHPKHYDIVIEGRPAVSENESVTGAIIRRLTTPPIPADRDLYRDIEGAPDEKIEDDEVVTLTKGAEFYSVPCHIAPGRA